MHVVVSLQSESLDLNQRILKLNNQMGLMARKKEEMDRTSKILKKSIDQNERAVDRKSTRLNSSH